ncbi:MAG: hypothetical protein ACJKTH_00885 [Patescibacteria group bacterium UBA2163]
MKLIGDFLDRFQNLAPPNDSVKVELIAALKETVDVSCSKKQITISNGVAYINVSSVVRNVIHVNRALVFENLFERLPRAKEVVREIR